MTPQERYLASISSRPADASYKYDYSASTPTPTPYVTPRPSAPPPATPTPTTPPPATPSPTGLGSQLPPSFMSQLPQNLRDLLNRSQTPTPTSSGGFSLPSSFTSQLPQNLRDTLTSGLTPTQMSQLPGSFDTQADRDAMSAQYYDGTTPTYQQSGAPTGASALAAALSYQPPAPSTTPIDPGTFFSSYTAPTSSSTPAPTANQFLSAYSPPPPPPTTSTQPSLTSILQSLQASPTPTPTSTSLSSLLSQFSTR